MAALEEAVGPGIDDLIHKLWGLVDELRHTYELEMEGKGDERRVGGEGVYKDKRIKRIGGEGRGW